MKMDLNVAEKKVKVIKREHEEDYGQLMQLHCVLQWGGG